VKKIFGVIFGVWVLASVASAAGLLSCGDTPIPIYELITSGQTYYAGCEAGDYEFTNFVVSGNIDPTIGNVTAGFSFGSDDSVTLDLHDTSDFRNNFTLTYTLTIDQTQPPAEGSVFPWVIYVATASLEDNPGPPPKNDAATWTKSVIATSGSGSGTATVIDTNGAATPEDIYPLSAEALAVTDTFNITNPGNMKMLDLSNIYYQMELAEPSTMILLGVALLCLGVVVRKRRKVCA
jgi:hypothetical protein